MKRIKHNDLTHYFIREHSQLPAAYLASCEKFFKNIKQRGLTKKEERLGWITRGHEPQAPSKQQAVDKRQAASYSRIIKEN
jgi:hypothetical protein